MKKLTIALFVLFSLATGSALANGSSKPIPPQSNGLVSDTTQGPGASIFDYFRRFFG